MNKKVRENDEDAQAETWKMWVTGVKEGGGGDGMGKERRKTSPETRRERRGEGRKKRRRDVDEKRTVKETETGR